MHHKRVRPMPGLWLRNLFIALCLSGIGLFSPAMQAAQAASLIVNTTDDVVDNDDGQCSLREAVAAANDDAPSGAVGGECRGGSGVDTIVLDSGFYTLDPALSSLDISSDMWIIGKGIGVTTVQANANPNLADYPVFEVSGAEVVIAHLTERYGGAVSGGSGGGIVHSSGDLTLYRVEVTWNRAGYSGGGIYGTSSGALNIVDSTVSQNELTGNGVVSTDVHGAGVDHSGGSLLIVNSSITDNRAGYTSMSGLGAVGGGINAAGSSFDMFYSTVSGNSAMTIDRFAFGGGVATNVSGALISHSTISGNHAMTVATDNRGAGGGVGNYDTLTVRNSTISGNEAFSASEAGGGGLANWSDGSMSLFQVTVTKNLVSTAGGVTAGSGVDQANGSVLAANTAIAENTGANQCSATLTAVGANADSDDSCGFTITDGPFNFLALADNGGRTQTHEVTTGSVLIGAGTPATCAASGIDSLDQMLASRLSSCTIGAYEYGGAGLVEPAALDDTAAVDEDPEPPVAYDLPSLLINDTGASGLSTEQAPAGLFSYSAPTGPSHADSFILNADGTYSYLPEENFYGEDPFLYWLTDGGSYPYDMALVRLSVTGVNDPPFFDPEDISFDNLFEDSVVGIHGLVIQDFDLEDCPGAVIKVRLKVEHGTLWLGVTTGLTFTIGDGLQSTPDKEIQFWGSLDDVNAALATLKYQGDQDYNGDENLTVGLNDMGYCDGDETGEGGCEGGGPGGTEPGGPGSDDNEVVYDDLVGFTIAPVNDPPVNTVPATQNTSMDTPLHIAGVTFKDVDLDRGEGDGMAHVVLTVVNGTASVTAAGSAVVTGSGSASVDILGPYADVKATLADILFTPTAGFMGTATIKVDTDDQGNEPDPAASDSDSFDIIVGPVPPDCGLVNCSFEDPAGPNKFPTGWRRAGLRLPGDGTDTGVHQDLAQSFRFKGTGKAKKLYQDVAITGPAGDDLSLSFWWKSQNVKGRPGLFRVVAYLTYNNNTKGKFYINLPVGTDDWTQNTLPIHARKAYKKLRVEIDFSKKGVAWFDNFMLTR